MFKIKNIYHIEYVLTAIPGNNRCWMKRSFTTEAYSYAEVKRHLEYSLLREYGSYSYTVSKYYVHANI